MNYELAKQLQDAGFPQSAPLEPYCLDCKNWKKERCLLEGHNTDYIKVPTLSELIEACGERFGSLVQTNMRDKNWMAVWESEPLEEEYIYGQIPEEAVAKLWLELNKNA